MALSFASYKNIGRVWTLDPKIDDELDLKEDVRELWLGIDGSYVAQRLNSGLRWNLQGHYKNLRESLSNMYKTGHAVKSLAMNMEDGEACICIWTDGTRWCSTGNQAFERSNFIPWANTNYESMRPMKVYE